MKKRTFVILSVILVLSFIQFAMGENILPDTIPDEVEEELPMDASSEYNVLPDDEADKPLPQKLPNPGSYFSRETVVKPFSESYSMYGKLFDCYKYPLTSNSTEQMDAFRNELDARRIESYPGVIEGQTALVITDGSHTAYLFIRYKDRDEYMFMVENGFEMDEQVINSYKLDRGDVIVSLPDGAKFEYENNSMKLGKLSYQYAGYDNFFGSYVQTEKYGHSDVLVSNINTDKGDIKLELPKDAQAGYSYRANKDSNSNELRITFWGNVCFGGSSCSSFGSSLYSSYSTYYYNQMKSDKDYLAIDVSYRDSRDIIGTIEGRFKDGETEFKIDFWLPIE